MREPSRAQILPFKVVFVGRRSLYKFTMGVEASTIEQQVHPDGATVIGLVSNRGGTGSVVWGH